MKASNSLACFHFRFASAELRDAGPQQPRGGKGSRKEGGKRGLLREKEGEEVRLKGLKRNVERGRKRVGEGGQRCRKCESKEGV